MPPKKEKKGGGKKKKSSNKDKDAGEVTLSPEDQIRLLRAEKAALELQLVCRREDTQDARDMCDKLRRELAEANKRHEEEKQLNDDVIKSMTRQYNSMLEQNIDKITERENIIQTLRDEIDAQKVATAVQIQKKVVQCRQEVEEMCKHFADLLVDATAKLEE
jgi:hypothetical protein